MFVAEEEEEEEEEEEDDDDDDVEVMMSKSFTSSRVSASSMETMTICPVVNAHAT